VFAIIPTVAAVSAIRHGELNRIANPRPATQLAAAQAGTSQGSGIGQSAPGVGSSPAVSDTSQTAIPAETRIITP